MFTAAEFYERPTGNKCPQCHGKDIRWLSGFYKRMFGQVVSKQRYQCKQCGRQWTTREGAPASVLRSAAGGVR